jgi:hypothetical protein
MDYIGTVLVFLGILLTASEAHQCSYVSSKGSYQYDFYGMRSAGDLTYKTKDGRTYYYQICSETFKNCPDSSICVTYGDDQNPVSIGLTDTAVWSDREDKPDEGVNIMYSSGEKCYGQGHRTTYVQLSCLEFEPLKKRSAYSSFITTVDDSDDCVVRINVSTELACSLNRTKEHSCPNCENGNTYRLNIFVVLIISTTTGLLIALGFVCLAMYARRRRISALIAAQKKLVPLPSVVPPPINMDNFIAMQSLQQQMPPMQVYPQLQPVQYFMSYYPQQNTVPAFPANRNL